jgi:beta-1,4-mannosyl-glycoprotein beta-1,4-N-acetylglucosaminyltransferase
MSKIYDCFSFYNEVDLLEIRLEELYDHVDHFVISEAGTTHSGKPKDFILLDNWERFKPWADKIIHVKVDDMPGVIDGNCWHNERHQRNCLERGLVDATDDDILLVGDVD